MEQPSPRQLGLQLTRELLGADIEERPQLGGSREVKDASNRRPSLRAESGEERGQARLIADIHRGQVDARAERFELAYRGNLEAQAAVRVDAAPGSSRRQLGSAQEDQPPRAALDHPA